MAYDPNTKEIADELKDWVFREGSIPYEDIRGWLAEKGVEGQAVGPILALGSTSRNNWWHKEVEGDMVNYVAGPKKEDKQKNAREAVPVVKDFETLDDPQKQMESIAIQIGIHPRNASAISHFVTRSYNVYDPEAVWTALTQATEISPSLRTRLWKTWNAVTGAVPPKELTARVEKAAMTDSEKEAVLQQAATPMRRRFLAVDGDVVAVGPDEDGLSLSEAIQLATVQRNSRNGHADSVSSVLPTLIHEAGENSRLSTASMMEMMREMKSGDGGMSLLMTTMLKMMDAGKEAEAARREADRERQDSTIRLLIERSDKNIELLQMNMNHQMEKFEQAMMHLSNRRSFFEELNEMVPGLGNKLLDKLLSNPQPGPQIAFKDANGNSIPMDLGAWKEIKSIEQKDALIEQARTMMPQFFRIGERMAEAAVRAQQDSRRMQEEYAAQQQQQEEGPASPPEAYKQGVCIGCKKLITYRAQAQAIQCAGCGTKQTPEGNAYIDPEETPENEQAPPEQPPAEQPVADEAPKLRRKKTRKEPVTT